MKTILKKVYQILPQKIKEWLGPLISRLSFKLQAMFNAYFPTVHVFVGQEKESLSPLSFAYVGFLPQLRQYWASEVLAYGFRHASAGRVWIWNLNKLIEANPTWGFILVEHTQSTLRYLRAKSSWLIPYWVSMQINIQSDINALFGEQRKDMDRRIRKNNLTYALSQAPSDFDDFYDHMFVPYIQGRHKDTVHMDSKESLREMFKRGELLLVKAKERVIAGALLEYEEGKCCLRRFGVRDGNWDYVQAGAIVAMYYFIAQELCERKIKTLSIGGTRALLSDGITRHKLSLGATIQDKQVHSSLWLGLLNYTIGVENFLVNTPFLFKTNEGQFKAAVFRAGASGQIKLPEGIDVQEYAPIKDLF